MQKSSLEKATQMQKSQLLETLKVSFEGEVHRTPFSFPVRPGEYALENLKMVILNIFNALKKSNFQITYRDDENDIVTVATQPELDEALSVAIDMGHKVLRFDVIRVKKNNKLNQSHKKDHVDGGESHSSASVAHLNVACDGCNMNPIIGARFKCSFRQNYDLCERCEAVDSSPYPFLKIKTPEQAPKLLVAVPRESIFTASETRGDSPANSPAAPNMHDIRQNIIAAANGYRTYEDDTGLEGEEETSEATVEAKKKEKERRRKEREKDALAELNTLQADDDQSQTTTRSKNGKVKKLSQLQAKKFASREGASQKSALATAATTGMMISPPDCPPSPPNVFGGLQETGEAQTLATGEATREALFYGNSVDAKFVADVNVPDGTEFEQGSPFLKTWRLRSGHGMVPECRLMFQSNIQSNNRLDGPREGILVSAKQPLQEFDVTVPLVAPAVAGRFTSRWRLMRTDTHEFIGDTVCAEIGVINTDAWDLVPSVKEDECEARLSSHNADEWRRLQAQHAEQRQAANAAVALERATLEREATQAREEAAQQAESQNTAAVEEGDERDYSSENSAAYPYSPENPFLEDCLITSNEGTQDDMHNDMVTKWAEALTVFYDMGFEDQERMISALEQHATPATWQEAENMQAIISAIL